MFFLIPFLSDLDAQQRSEHLEVTEPPLILFMLDCAPKKAYSGTFIYAMLA